MYLGLDLGTSGLKGLLIDAEQTIVGQANAPLQVSRPQSAWSEQDPAHWIAAAEAVLAELSGSYPKELAALKGIGLSGQMHGATLLDAADRVLRPCILWNDTRAAVEAARLDAQPGTRDLVGSIIFPGFTAPKLAWVKAHEPEVFAQVAKVLLPKDYLRLWLTGDHVSEMSDASGTGWLDVGQRAWSHELLAQSDMSLGQMPALVEGSAPSGSLRAALAERFGLPHDVIVAGGAGDNAASACGMGTVVEGRAFVSIGTSGVLFAANESFRPNAASAVHTFCHALPKRWHQMGVILAATDALNWYAGITGQAAKDLTAELGGALRAPNRTLFLPYIGGERTPHNDAAIRGAFIGLEHAADRAALTRAVLEGVAFAFCDSRDALAACGTRLERVTAVGGGSLSDYWLKVMATALDLPVDVPASGDFGAAFGAARLGLIAASSADPLSVCTAPEMARTIEPNASLVAAFAEAHARFKAAYPALKEITP